MGARDHEALRVGFDPVLQLEFQGAQVSSDAGLFAFRDLDEAAPLSESSTAERFDFRTGSNIRPARTALLRQSIYNRLPGHPERRFGVPCPSVAMRRGLFRLNSRWDWRYIGVLGDRRCRRVQVISEMSASWFWESYHDDIVA